MQVTLTLASGTDDACDIELHSRGAVSWEQARKALAANGLLADEAPMFSGNQLLKPTDRLGEPILRSGSRLCTSRGNAPADPTGLVLQVVSGPDSGCHQPLKQGSHVVGRGPDADLRVSDQHLSRRHLQIDVELHAATVMDLGSTNGSSLDGQPIPSRPVRLSPGMSVIAGYSQFQLLGVGDPPAIVRGTLSGRWLVHRPPQTGPAWRPSPHVMPRKESQAPRPRLSWMAASLPALASVALALAFRSPQLLAFAAISPISVVATALTERRAWARQHRLRHLDHLEAVGRARQAIDVALKEESLARARIFPAPATVFATAVTPTCRLWERHPEDPAFLAIRLGLADQPAETKMVEEASGAVSAGQLAAAPVVVDLSTGVLGLAGPRVQQLASARFAIAQLITLHSPTDLDLVVLLNPAAAGEWRWLRWAHAHLTSAATTAADRSKVTQELLALLKDREQPAGVTTARWRGRWTVVLMDLGEDLVDEGSVRVLLERGPQFGIVVLCLAAERRGLPSTCSSTLELDYSATGLARLSGRAREQLELRPDGVSGNWSEQLSRALAPLDDADPTGIHSMPAQLGLAELVLPVPLAPEAIRRLSDRRSDKAVPIGLSTAGPFSVDLVEDGPHVLIAGTTGAGKSELLRTLVTALACGHAPDLLSFILIDYKGGAAFAECATFPHVLGVFTDLNAQLTRRALVSLDAELRKREEAFARAGVSDLASFQRSAHASTAHLSRLVLIIDEFATLADELPEFLDGLLGIAQRGRSLGVHLVLATQRPAGVVSQDIKANMSLRIALRMTDASESQDVINSDQASRISRGTPGRAIARRSDGELVEFQAARVTAPAVVVDGVQLAVLDDWNRRPPRSEDEDAVTELDQLHHAFATAASGYRLPPRPWLDPLPALATNPIVRGSRLLSLGTLDRPELQSQEPLTLDLEAGGVLGLIGGPRSGRTAAARSSLGVAVCQLTEDELHLYVIDCAGGAMRPAAGLPQCGTYADLDDQYRLTQLVARLGSEIATRKRVLAECGATCLREARDLGRVLPAVLIVLHGWEAFTSLSDEVDGGRTAELFIKLMRDGSAAGFNFVICGDRGLLSPRISAVITRKLVLPMTDPGDYVLAGLHPDHAPAQACPGRGVDSATGSEFQLGLLHQEQAAATRWRAIEKLARWDGNGRSGPTIRLRPLPERVNAAELGTESAGHGFRLGLGGDTGEPVVCDLVGSERYFLVAGPARSGKSTAAVRLADQALLMGLRLAVAAGPRSPLRAWAKHHRHKVIMPADTVADPIADLLILDDVEQFSDSPAGEGLLKWVASGEVAAAVTARSEDLLATFRGLGVEVRRHRTGVLLQPTASDGELLGVRIPRGIGSAVPGRGVLVTTQTRSMPDGLVAIQLALP